MDIDNLFSWYKISDIALINQLSKCAISLQDKQEELQKLENDKKKIDSQFETVKALYKEDDFVRRIGRLASDDGDILPQKVDDLLKTYIEYSNLIVNFLRKRKRALDKEINLGDVLKEVWGFYQSIVKSFDITVDFICEDSIMYEIMQIDFESIVINMITNAFEQVKGREDRRIIVTIFPQGAYLIICFEDSGAGVPIGKEKEIFRPFETSKENGIGLGLNIVKDIVEKYHGEVSVKRSETLHGAKFIVALPIGDE